MAARVSLFLAGDVVPARGVDQLLPVPSRPTIHESYCRSALDYVALAEKKLGRPLPRGVPCSYPWGDALPALAALGPDVRIVNLETAVTTSEDYWKGKGINYRMHPGNAGFVQAAGLHVASLSNNHVLDWGYEGLGETLAAVRGAGVLTAGAGKSRAEAEQPAVVEVRGGRLLVFAFSDSSSGVPEEWEALPPQIWEDVGRPGVAMIHLSDAGLGALRRADEEVERIKKHVDHHKRPGDIVLASIHWGGNWDFGIPAYQKRFARGLVDQGVDLIHGHSSHHAKGLEVYRGKLITYGLGDLLNDYEGISGLGEERFRGDLGAMYFPTLDAATGRLHRLIMAPTTVRAFRVERAGLEGARWLQEMVAREGREKQLEGRPHLSIMHHGSATYPVEEDLGPLLDLHWGDMSPSEAGEL